MNRRLVLATVAVGLVASTAGCLGFVTGGGSIDDATLDADPAEPYEFDTGYDGYIVIEPDADYRAVYRVDGTEEIRLFSENFRAGEDPIDVRAFRARYADGTVVNGSTFRADGGEVERTTDEVWVRPPPDRDLESIAFTADSTPRRFSERVPTEGRFEVVLPPDRRVDFFLFGNVAPGGYETRIEDGRQRISWAEMETSSVLVQYYRQRDLRIFAVVVVIAVAIGIGGIVRIRRQLRELERQREALGLGVESDEDDERREG